MASYFDLPSQPKEAPSNPDTVSMENRSLLSPAVTQLLDSLDQEASDSDSEEGETPHLNTRHKPISPRLEASRTSEKSSLSPKQGERSLTSRTTQVRVSPEGPRKTSLKSKPPHMARFHSLRSMLFTSNVEHKIEECKQIEAVDQWKNQHDQRKMGKPHKLEQNTQREKLGSRIKTRIRRMTSKEVPTLVTLKESGDAHDFSDRGSTASSDAEAERVAWTERDADEESIDHSDVEELVRWVSRRDPPSDGEAHLANEAGVVQEIKENNGHDSLGHSDVDDLVRWVSRKPAAPETPEALHTGYSDASTESDSEMERDQDSSEDEDADDLVRWISHRDGPNAGPVRKTQEQSNTLAEQDHAAYDSDIPELGRWVKRHDDTSGESNASASIHEAHNAADEPQRGRPRSREHKHHITEGDIADLVRWVSRNSSKPNETPKPQEEAKHHTSVVDKDSAPHSPGQAETGTLHRKPTSEREAVKPVAQGHLQKSRNDSALAGAAVFVEAQPRSREGSLAHEDVDELVHWVSQKT